MDEHKIAIALLGALLQSEMVSFEVLETKFEKLNRRHPNLIADFGIDTIERVCRLHPYELQIYTDERGPCGIKRGEIWSAAISKIAMESYCRAIDKKYAKSLSCLIYL